MESLLPDGGDKEKLKVLNMTLSYLYSKFFKRVLRGKSIFDSKVDTNAMIYSGTNFYKSSIERYSYVGYDCEVICCKIGAFCSIANGVVIGGAQHPLDWVSTSPVFYNVAGGTGKHLGSLPISESKITHIGNDVWIGQHAIIMQGVTIGNGAVIGAGAVVTKDVPPYAIVAGVPAKVLRYRFNEDLISQLQESKWWTLPDETLRKLGKHMDCPNRLCKLLKDSQIGGVNYG